MTENEKVIVQVPEKQKLEVPFSIYMLMFFQIVLLAFIAWNTGDAVALLSLMYLGM